MMCFKKRSRRHAAWVAKVVGIQAMLCISMGMTACEDGIGDDNTDDVDAVESVSEKIVYGTELSVTSARNSGVVFLTPIGCSGTLLSSRWVLTAAHCFANNEYNNPGSVTVRFGHASDANAPVRTPAQILKHPNATWGSSSGVDAALIYLSSNAPSISPPSGHFTNGRMLIFGDSNSKLQNAVLKSIGYGKNTPVYGPPWGGVGTLREGEIVVTGTNSTKITIASNNPPTGLDCNGDSGGPAFLDVWGNGGIVARYVAGITSQGNCQTWGSYTAPEAFRDWVQQTVFGTYSSSINCSGSTCSSTPRPLPNATFSYNSYSPWGASRDECYYVTASYGFESNYDFFNIGNDRLTGSGALRTHWCGALPLSLTTDGSVHSNGLSWLGFTHHTANTMPPSSQCAGVSGGWVGCRGTGCSACIEELTDYSRYFENHPNCIPNTSCGAVRARCSANCPAPTSADR